MFCLSTCVHGILDLSSQSTLSFFFPFFLEISLSKKRSLHKTVDIVLVMLPSRCDQRREWCHGSTSHRATDAQCLQQGWWWSFLLPLPLLLPSPPAQVHSCMCGQHRGSARFSDRWRQHPEIESWPRHPRVPKHKVRGLQWVQPQAMRYTNRGVST